MKKHDRGCRRPEILVNRPGKKAVCSRLLKKHNIRAPSGLQLAKELICKKQAYFYFFV